jgi:choline-sulfatase
LGVADPGSIERRGGETIDRVLDWLQSPQTQAERKPFFVWLHLYDPHSPYNPPEPFRTEYRGRLYDGEVAYVDSQLTRLFAYLKRRDLYNRMWIVLTSDHGESLGEHGEQEHGFFVYQSTLHVPLIFKPPHGVAPHAVLAGAVETIDIAPTLLDLLGLQDVIRRQFQGTSLAGAVLGKSPEIRGVVYAESYYAFHSFGWSPLRSLVAGGNQFIQAPQQELYDLREDPRQTHNLASAQRARTAALEQQLTSLETRFAAPHQVTQPSRPPLADATVQELKSLGYLAYAAPAEPGSTTGLPDPKQELSVYNAILRATDLARMGKLAESNAALQRIQTKEPKLYLIPFLLGENSARAGQWAKAIVNFQAALKLNPNFLQAIMGMGRSYLNGGDAEKARPWFELALHNNPNEFLADQGLGLIARQQGRLEDALGYFSKTLQQQPEYSPAALQLGICLVELRRYQEAIKPLELAARTNAANAEAWNYLGTARTNTGQIMVAIAAYQTALRLQPEYSVARLNLAFAYLKSGYPSTARKQFLVLCRQQSPLCQQYQSTFQK